MKMRSSTILNACSMFEDSEMLMWLLTWDAAVAASVTEGKQALTAYEWAGIGCNLRVISVMTANVPSEPINKRVKS